MTHNRRVVTRTPANARALSLHRFLLRFALAGAHVFAWVFLFNYFYLVSRSLPQALAQTALLYALSQIVSILATPLAARALRMGARRVLFLSLLFALSAFIVLGTTFAGVWGTSYEGLPVALFSVLLGLYRAFYFAPYEMESALSKQPARSGRSDLLVALIPALSGIFIAASPDTSYLLLYAAAALIGLSCIPVFQLRDVYEGYAWGYRQTFHQLVDPRHRAMTAHSFLEGFSGAALLLFWPLAIFLITGWSYGVLGIILSITFFVVLLARAPVRAMLRRFESRDSWLLTGTLAITPWIFRLTIATPLGAIATDTYFYTTAKRRLGIDPFVFQQSSDGGMLIDEYTALKEMSLAAGRSTLCILGAFIVLTTSVPVALAVVFIIAAIASTISALRS